MVGGLRAFAERKFAERNGACLLQLLDHGSTESRHKIPEDFRAGHCCDTLRVTQVLDTNRNTVQRPAIMTSQYLGLGPPRGGDGAIGSYGDVALEMLIFGFDAIQHHLR